jgi:hypothetical protein
MGRDSPQRAREGAERRRERSEREEKRELDRMNRMNKVKGKTIQPPILSILFILSQSLSLILPLSLRALPRPLR